MGSMSMGGDIPKPAPVVAPVTSESTDVVAATDAVKRRIRAQQGRQSTFIVPVASRTKSLVGD